MFINWSTVNHPSFHGPSEKVHMLIKPVRKFENYGVKDFGLKAPPRIGISGILHGPKDERHVARCQAQAQYRRQAERQKATLREEARSCSSRSSGSTTATR